MSGTNRTIGGLVEATTLDSTTLFEVQQDGAPDPVSRRVTAPNVRTYMQTGAVLAARAISAGSGLTGGGDLSADRTLAIATGGVTRAMMANMATARLLGRSTAGSGAPEEIAIGAGLSLTGGELTATGGGSGQAAVQIQDEGSNLGTAGTATTLNFAGAGVTAARTGDAVTVTIPGGGGGGGVGAAKPWVMAGHYIVNPDHRAQNSTNTTAVAGRRYLSPFRYEGNPDGTFWPITAAFFRVFTASAGTVKAGLYTDDGTTLTRVAVHSTEPSTGSAGMITCPFTADYTPTAPQFLWIMLVFSNIPACTGYGGANTAQGGGAQGARGIATLTTDIVSNTSGLALRYAGDVAYADALPATVAWSAVTETAAVAGSPVAGLRRTV